MVRKNSVRRRATKPADTPTRPAIKPASTVVWLSGSKPKSLKDVAYEALKHRIITCVYKPGECINEASVSKALRVGRTPVHQAMGRLMLEGLLSVIPRKGVVVKPLTLDEIVKIIEVRILNETHCVGLAAERADDQEIAHLHNIIMRSREQIPSRNTEALMLLDREFHSVLARASKNEVLGGLLLNLHERALRFWFLSLDRQGHHEKVQKQHEEIFAMIRDRNSGGAQAAMKNHIESFRSNLMNFEG